MINRELRLSLDVMVSSWLQVEYRWSLVEEMSDMKSKCDSSEELQRRSRGAELLTGRGYLGNETMRETTFLPFSKVSSDRQYHLFNVDWGIPLQ
jgi:hypothetical protein